MKCPNCGKEDMLMIGGKPFCMSCGIAAESETQKQPKEEQTKIEQPQEEITRREQIQKEWNEASQESQRQTEERKESSSTEDQALEEQIKVEEPKEEIVQKKQEIEQKEQAIEQKEQAIKQKEQAIKEEQEIKQKEQEIKQKEQEIKQKEQAIKQKEQEIKEEPSKEPAPEEKSVTGQIGEEWNEASQESQRKPEEEQTPEFNPRFVVPEHPPEVQQSGPKVDNEFYATGGPPESQIKSRRIRRINFKPFFIILGLAIVVLFIISLFVFEPFINLRYRLLKYTQPVTELAHFKNKTQFALNEAKAWDSKAYLTMVDMTENPAYKPSNFSIKDTYHFVFASPNKPDDLAVFFVSKDRDNVIGNIKIKKSNLGIPMETDGTYSAVSSDNVGLLAEEVLPGVEVGGLDNFLKKYKTAKLKIGPVLEYSSKYAAAYWLYIYETSDNIHKFMVKVNAVNGQILEKSER